MRARLPARRTLPSSKVATFSRRPMAATVSPVPRNWKDELRAATRRPRILASMSSSSSARPSEKYSCSSSRLRFTKGNTAMEAIAAGGAAASESAPAASLSVLPLRSAISASRRAAALGQRSAGAFARQRCSRRTSGAGSASPPRPAKGSSRRMALASSGRLAPVKGRRPVASSKRSTPTAKRSLAGAAGSPRSCSGAM